MVLLWHWRSLKKNEFVDIGLVLFPHFHFLIVPTLHVASLKDCDDSHQALLGSALLLAPKLAAQQGLVGFKTLINTGREGGQEVFHLHVHVFGGGAV